VIDNTGPLDTKRMETVDEEFLAAAIDFIERKAKGDAPWFCYFNPTRMHVWTHLKPASKGMTGLGTYPDGMVELDGYVGALLDKLDELGLADDTVVVFTTDNGAEKASWPDGGASPFRSEKDTNWEGGWRAPCVMRWQGVVEPGRIINDIGSLQDFIPTFAAAAGEPDLIEKVRQGYAIGGVTFKVHLDGVNLLPFLKGEAPCPREGFIYWSDDGDLLALRVGAWKIGFAEQRSEGVKAWEEPFVQLRSPSLYNLRSDPFEEGHVSMLYERWKADHMWTFVTAQTIIGQWLVTFKEFPPRAKAASFSVGGRDADAQELASS
jgi:arylsulfatase A-like enzyme